MSAWLILSRWLRRRIWIGLPDHGDDHQATGQCPHQGQDRIPGSDDLCGQGQTSQIADLPKREMGPGGEDRAEQRDLEQSLADFDQAVQPEHAFEAGQRIEPPTLEGQILAHPAALSMRKLGEYGCGRNQQPQAQDSQQ